MGLLGWGDAADFAAAAGVYGVKGGGYDVWRGQGCGGGRLCGEEMGDECFLQAGGCGVGDEAWEMDMKEFLPHWAHYRSHYYMCMLLGGLWG